MEPKKKIEGYLQTLIDVYKYNFGASWQEVFVRTVSIDATKFIESTTIKDQE